MRAAQFNYFGSPLEVIELVEVPDPPPPDKGEVGIDVMYVPVNVGDLLAMEGRYGASAVKLPRIAGVEGLGRVSSVGTNVTNIQIGDRVLLPPGHGTWCEKITVPAVRVTPLPEEGDAQQLCMMRANPASAYLMLTTFVDLSPGDWVIQNAANSGVGQYLIQLAKLEGFKTVNIVRRPRTVETLRQLGADIVVYSTTKHIDGQGRALGGAILCDKEFHKELVTPFMRHTGPAMSPFNAWICLKGLETLDLRVHQHCQNALQIARFLEAQATLDRVIYPGLESPPQHELCKRQMSGASTVVSFELTGGKETAFKFLNALFKIHIIHQI